MIVPVTTSEESMLQLASVLGCSIGSPSNYLGMPLGLKKPTIADLMPLAKKCEKRLWITTNMLSQGGKLVLVNSVLTSYPTFLMGLLKVHKTMVKHLLWRGADPNDRKPPVATRQMVFQTIHPFAICPDLIKYIIPLMIQYPF